MRILVLNGPNLNLLGHRQPEIYGRETLDDIETLVRNRADERGIDVLWMQTNSEGEMVDAVHEHRDYDGMIINAAAYTHTSIAIADAVAAVDVPTVEVHISNVYAREPFRHHSYLAPVAWGQLTGFGYRGYVAALDLLYDRLIENPDA